MNVICKICRRPVTPSDGIMLSALGYPLFPAHRIPCAQTLHNGVDLATRFALQGLGKWAKGKLPAVFATLKAVYDSRRLGS